ncbi:SpoIIE family protein phosphatase [uncultured Paraglaciecola sp.]|uniref:SpoIIE family protein phosphatase n=1 Tax=uncultured Paraglaciecola sp. TaxID=1765024 RepID=UPI00262F012D|nr:SpoIIE family protein phosphatase [uncultured Paraglaciecola sp.]
MKISFGIKFGVFMQLAITILVGSMLLFFYRYSSNMMKNDLKDMIADVTRTSAYIFNEEDRDLIESFREQVYKNLPDDYQQVAGGFAKKAPVGETKEIFSNEVSAELQSQVEFQYIIQLLRRIQAGSKETLGSLSILPQANKEDVDASDIAWAYLMVVVPGLTPEKTLMFLADSNYQGSASVDPNPVGNLYRGDSFTLKAFKGEIGITDDWTQDKFGTVMSGTVPIRNDKGEIIAALGIDYLVDVFSQRVEEQKYYGLLMFVASVALGLVLTLFVTAWVSIPLSKLRIGAEQLSKQDFNHRVNINSNDEFGLVARTFNKVSEDLEVFTKDLDSIVKSRTAQLSKAQEKVESLNNILKQENAHLGAEVADLIGLRERTLPYLNQNVNIAALQVVFHYLPSQAVCGDFWTVSETDESVDIVLGHVSGYGLETAMMAMQVQTLLKAAGHNVDERFKATNQYLFEQKKSTNLKLFCKVLSVQTTEQGLSLAGCIEAPIKFNSANCEFVDLKAMVPLGVGANVSIEHTDIAFKRSDRLFLFSTGFKYALAQLHKMQANDLQAKDIINFSGILSDSVDEVLASIETQSWFDDFNQDISFIIIHHKGD